MPSAACIALASRLNLVLVVGDLAVAAQPPAMCGLEVSGEALFGV